MKKSEDLSIWEYFADTPEEFTDAIKNSQTLNEKIFFEKFRHKLLTETAASNDVLMSERDNEDGLYILRVGSDDIMLGTYIDNPSKMTGPVEYAGLFFALTQDLFPFIGRHITLLQWLRARDFKGIRYDQNNDYL